MTSSAWDKTPIGGMLVCIVLLAAIILQFILPWYWTISLFVGFVAVGFGLDHWWKRTQKEAPE